MQPASRKLGRPAALAVVTGESVALGIFLTPASMAHALGSPLLLALVWCGLALMALCGALCFAELAVAFPESGGEFVYLRKGFGDAVAFLFGWMSAMVMYPGVAAALAVGAAAYVTALVPMESRIAASVPALLVIGFGALNLLGTRFSGRLVTLLNAVKFAVLFTLVAWVFISGRGHLANLVPFADRRPGSDPLFAAVAGAAVSGFFAFGGWWEAGKIAGEVRDPRKTLPFAFVGGVLLVTAIYLLVSFSFLSVRPLSTITSSIAFVDAFGDALFGALGAKLLSGCVLLCVCGGLAALMMAAPRVSCAMARAGQFFPAIGRVDHRSGAPRNAVLLHTGLSLAALLLGTFDRILAYIIFSAVVFLAITAATVFRLPQRPRAWWYPLAPILFLLCSSALALLILLHNPRPALLGVFLVLCGLPLRRIAGRHFHTVPRPAYERT